MKNNVYSFYNSLEKTICKDRNDFKPFEEDSVIKIILLNNGWKINHNSTIVIDDITDNISLIYIKNAIANNSLEFYDYFFLDNINYIVIDTLYFNGIKLIRQEWSNHMNPDESLNYYAGNNLYYNTLKIITNLFLELNTTTNSVSNYTAYKRINKFNSFYVPAKILNNLLPLEEVDIDGDSIISEYTLEYLKEVLDTKNENLVTLGILELP